MKLKTSLKLTPRNRLRTTVKFRILYIPFALSLFTAIAIFIVVNSESSKRTQAEITTGTTYTFTGATDNQWKTGSNWDLGNKPGNGDNVIIPAGKTCDLGVTNANINNLTVNGSFTESIPAKDLYVSGAFSGSGTFYNNGQFYLSGGGNFSGTITNGYYMTITGPYTFYGSLINSWSLTTVGAVTFASGSLYQHNQEAGAIPTATWNANSTCLVTGISNTAPTGLAQSFGNFTWSCNNQAGDVGALGPMTVAGTLTIANTGSKEFKLKEGTSTVGTYNQTGGRFVLISGNRVDRTFNVNGNCNISGGTFYISYALGAGSTVNGTMNVSGNYTQSGGDVVNADVGVGAMNVSGNFTMTNGTFTSFSTSTLSLYGNMTVNGGTFAPAAGLTVFTGSNLQTVAGTAAISYNNIRINKTAASKTVTLSRDVTVNGTMTFTKGIVDALTNYTSTPLLNFSTTASVASSPSDSSFVKGPVRKITNTTSLFTFPIGGPTYYRPASITPSNTNSTTWTARYYWATPPNYGLYSLNYLNRISDKEYWDINRATGGTPADAKVRLSWNAFSGVSYPEYMGVVHFSATYALWQSCSGIGIFTYSGDTLAGYVETTINWNDFSPFTLGSISSKNHSLPVELLSFDATASDNVVNLNWATASETNNNYFSIERSDDGVTYASIGIKDGAGNSNVMLEYNFTDNDPIKGVNYYRLKQVDFDGAFVYSNAIAVNMALSGSETVTITAGPNPFIDNININYSSALDGPVEVKLFDLSGKVVKTMKTKVSSGLNTFLMNDNRDLPAGIYMLGIINDSKMAPLIKMVKK